MPTPQIFINHLDTRAKSYQGQGFQSPAGVLKTRAFGLVGEYTEIEKRKTK